MDALLLSRIQFAFTVGFHFIFVPISIGLALMVVAAERRYYKRGDPADKAASAFWIKLFTTTFAIGVATGITMEFAFGTNWANYSRFVGNIFGAPLAAEALFSFFLESTFLGVLLFGRKKVSRGFYYASTWLVMFGAFLSAFWIIIANSWQQTPQGYKVVGGKAVLTNFWAAAFNPSTMPRYTHTVTGAIVVGSFVVVSICAWYLLKKRHLEFARRALLTSLVVGLVASAAMPLLGHWGSLVVAEHHPVKMAAFENLYETEDGAPLWIVGWVKKEADGSSDTVGLKIPNGLSLILHLNPKARIIGLQSVPTADRPPEQLVFQSYHLMIALSIFFVAVMVLALFMYWRKRLEKARWLLWLLVICFPLPIIAMNLGWMSAEVGRQPWIVQGLLRTSDGVSPVVSASEVLTTLVVFGLIYLLLFIAWARLFLGIVRKGPDEPAEAIAAPDAGAPAPAGAEG
jgi:cytochrome bd ubiquinol oxidase subunit I